MRLYFVFFLFSLAFFWYRIFGFNGHSLGSSFPRLVGLSPRSSASRRPLSCHNPRLT